MTKVGVRDGGVQIMHGLAGAARQGYVFPVPTFSSHPKKCP